MDELPTYIPLIAISTIILIPTLEIARYHLTDKYLRSTRLSEIKQQRLRESNLRKLLD